jgi:hypothetical protein
MISYCPFCADILPERLIDGFILCPKCNKIIESSRKNILLAAYKILKKKQYTNLKQFKFEILEAYEIDCLTLQEFEKKIKTLVVA